MSVAIEWIAFFLFLLLFAGAIVGEIMWLTRKGWATSGRSTGYVLASDALGFFIGSFFAFGILMMILMMTFGPAGRGSTAPESAYWVASAAGLIFPPIFLILSKRLFLGIFKIRSGSTAWAYSATASLVILVVVLIPPPALFLFGSYLSQWK